MARKGSAKPCITIVGAGNLASTLALALRAAGYSIEQIVSHAGASSMRRAANLARKVDASPVPVSQAKIRADVVWFCVPDGEIANAAASLANSADWKGKVALHSSGALTSDELAVLRRRGAAVASVHPLMTFVPGSRPTLDGVPFAIEGDPRATKVAKIIVHALSGRPFPIRKENKDAYHAWGMFASPLLTALLAVTERVAMAAGVNRKAARQRMLPILKQTLANYERLGAAGSLSGPFVRGDVATVQKHLQVLKRIPDARNVYVTLTRGALRDLPAKHRASLKKSLKD